MLQRSFYHFLIFNKILPETCQDGHNNFRATIIIVREAVYIRLQIRCLHSRKFQRLT